MKNLIIFFLLSVYMLVNNCDQTIKEIPLIPLEDFFKNPEKDNFHISPEGDYFSFMSPYKNRMNVFVQKIGSDSAIQVTWETDRDIAGYFWANNKRILYLKDTGGDENFHLYGVDYDGSNLKGLTVFDSVRTTIIDELVDFPEYVIIGLNKRDKTVFDPYRLNIVTGELELLAINPGDIIGWLTDHNGKLRAAVSIKGLETSILYRETEQDKFRPVLTTNYKDQLNPLFFDFDNKHIYASSNIGRDKSEIILFNISEGEELETIFKNDEVDVYNLNYSRKRKVLTSISYYTDKKHHFFFDKEAEDIYNRVDKDLGKYEIRIISENLNEDKFIVRTFSDKTRGSYYFFDYKNDKLMKLHDIAPWLKEENMAEMKPIKYLSRDSLTIHGYLTIPIGQKPKKIPVVVHPHGGPTARDFWGFDPEVQFLVNRGYAVFQMNFRGSTGYGRTFKEAGYGQWGLQMQDDITDGVEWLIEEGIAHKNKVAIYGGSYGGYATLAGLAFTPDLYCCGVDYVGVSNIFTILENIPPYWEPLRIMMYETIGDPEKDSLRLKATSPVFHADKITAPLFIAQGANDPRVNKIESDQMVEAMKKRGVEVEYMVKDNEGHGFRNEENRFDFYRAMIVFLDKHIKNK
ncbi:MAG: S9 family peptidase [Bacteroidales bacterium]|nr:S9 family peptidase [Bacteroidales bacterium]